jgi:glyoxylase-like metal-dependent hydrolase (beta-lactamase superfamily II)
VNRRHFLTTSSLALAGTAFARVPVLGQAPGAQTPAAQTPAAPPVTKFEELRRGVGIFTGSGGTIGYLVTPDGALAVDSQFMNTAEIAVAGLKQRAPKGIELLINTHHHGDHTGGNAAFRPAVKRIVAHENCVAWHKKVAEQAKNAAQQAFADTTFKDEWKVDFGGETVHARYFGPGHTSGDAVIFFEKANIMHGGDLLFRRVHPRVDGPAGASVVNWANILDKAAGPDTADTIFIFGHGKDNIVRGTVSDVKYFRDYLRAAIEHTQKAIKAGQSKEEAAKIASLPGFDDVGQVNPRIGLAGVIEAAYDELKK